MRLQVTHLTRYDYSQPVFLEPQVLRLKPATNAAQRLLDFDLQIDPQPAGRSSNTDLEGNETTVVWFDGLTSHLNLVSTSRVETLRENPYQYLWDGPSTLPVAYPESDLPHLTPYREQGFIDPSVRVLATELMDQAEGNAQGFLSLLTSRIHKSITRIYREVGAAHAPEETLRRGEGSCRDLTVLLLAVARASGFAGRFVSGYYSPAGIFDDFELHAWAELYLPGGGWRGFDPTAGLAAADRHIAIAYAAQPDLAAPVRGSLRGTGTTQMTTKVHIIQQ